MTALRRSGRPWRTRRSDGPYWPGRTSSSCWSRGTRRSRAAGGSRRASGAGNTERTRGSWRARRARTRPDRARRDHFLDAVSEGVIAVLNEDAVVVVGGDDAAEGIVGVAHEAVGRAGGIAGGGADRSGE